MLHCLGPAVQIIFSTLPDENTTLEATKETLTNCFAPKRNVVAERYKFRSFRELAKSCDFAALEEEMIRDQIMERCHSKSLKQRLLQQESLDLQKTMKLARREETAAQEARLLSNGSRDDPIKIDKIKEGGSHKKDFTCYRC